MIYPRVVCIYTVPARYFLLHATGEEVKAAKTKAEQLAEFHARLARWGSSWLRNDFNDIRFVGLKFHRGIYMLKRSFAM